MAISSGNTRFVFVGLWVAFVAFVLLYWHSVTKASSLINQIDELNVRVADVNATLDELRYELNGFAGCATVKEETKKQKEVLQNSLPDKDKAITDKTAAAAKAAENLNAFKTEHVKANATYYQWYTKFVALNETCTQKLLNITTACEEERNKTSLLKSSKSASFLSKLFGNV